MSVGSFLTYYGRGIGGLAAPAASPTLTDRYTDILLALQSLIVTAGNVPSNRSIITLWPEPYPTQTGPVAYIMPGRQTIIGSQVDGAGRYFAGMESVITLRVVDRAYRDQSYSQTFQLTDATRGLYTTVHGLINTLHEKFLYNASAVELLEEPLVVLGISEPARYRQAPEWAYVDLSLRVRYTLNITPTTPTNTYGTIGSGGTNLAQLLIAVQQLLIGQGVFTGDYQVPISTYVEPFPSVTPPYGVIAPGRFALNDRDDAGAGRYFTLFRGTISVHVIGRNIQDISQQSTLALTATDPLLGLLSKLAQVVSAMELSFPLDTTGASYVEEPIRLVEVKEPVPYGGVSRGSGRGAGRGGSGAGQYTGIESVWEVLYQEALTVP